MAVTLYRQVKVSNGGRRYVRVNLGRGRRPADLSGPYYLRYFCPTRNRRVWEHAGDDLTEAIRLADQKEGFLQAKSAGVPVAEPRNDNRVRIDDAIEEYFANLAAQGKDPKTIRAYRVAIDQFRQSCPKVYVNEVKKQDLLNFMAWLRRQPRKPRRSGDPNRTFFNKTGHVVVFLKAYGVSRILKKSEYPRFNPKPVEYYSADQVKALYAAAKGDEERFTLDYFLKTGVRDGEAGHALYTDVKDGFLYIAEKPEWNWHPKHWQCRRIPIPSYLVAAIEERHKKNPGTKLIFPNSNNKPNQHLIRVVQRIAERIGEDMHADLHTFRRTYATLYSHTLNVQTIQ